MADVPPNLVERLYTTPPDGFVATRAEAVAAARAAGDAAAAREIAKLRKPTIAAWLVNLLAWRRPELMAELVELSAELRAAQRELSGARLRELSAQRRRAVAALVGEARTLARATDPRLAAGKLPLAEVETTLNAALADAEVAEQVRSGRLVRAASYAGFGEVPRPQLRLIVGGPEGAEPAGPSTPEPEGAPARRARHGAPTASAGAAARPERATAEERRVEARAAQRRALERTLAEARTRQERAEAELERASQAERDAAAALAELDAALAELERRRDTAGREADRAKRARRTAERDAVAARRRVGEIEAAIEALIAEGESSGKRGRLPGKSLPEADSSG
ncbi:hypothetical protein [Micromonospora sp. HM5-17]|jgi:hypothetical protein|uniref:hypothetical protein n=1 Tax=Micromonospora sp. HM5-17 TaxID=2487710 RepID=UPI000F482038|nr:hypothetical protein [Micromonospora sp. HM5-17]ROT32112.1 hypothetical protein EF879_10895 [Micromonospora sp. HM5-17]